MRTAPAGGCLWRRRRWLWPPFSACGAGLLPPRHLPLLPVSCTQACWAILFISNNTEEPTEHTQMRFELASATLAERIQLGIVAVHEAPEAAAEFLTMETPQIGAPDVSHGTPHRICWPRLTQRVARAQSFSITENVPHACQTMRGGIRASPHSSHAVRRARPPYTPRVRRFRQAARFGSGHTRGRAVDASHSVRCRSRSRSL